MVTEGILTLGEVLRILEEGCPPEELKPNAAVRLTLRLPQALVRLDVRLSRLEQGSGVRLLGVQVLQAEGLKVCAAVEAIGTARLADSGELSVSPEGKGMPHTEPLR